MTLLGIIAGASLLPGARKIHTLWSPVIKGDLRVIYSKVLFRDRRRSGLFSRWEWCGVLRPPEYERLILIGEKDSRYPDVTGEGHVFFDIPYHKIRLVTIKDNTNPMIQLNTQADIAKKSNSAAGRMFVFYQTTRQQIEERYGI